MAITWTEDLRIGVEEVDNQHKELIRRMDGLFEACNKGKGKEEVVKVIDYLGEYVVEHFSAEEELQRKFGYPQYNAHKKLHGQFIDNFKGIKAQLDKEGVNPLLIIQMNRLLIEWLLQHIKKADKELGKYLKEKI